MTALLDVNVLLALIREDHEFHAAAEEWFQQHRREGWATCVLTEAGLIRIAMQFGLRAEVTLGVLTTWSATAEHAFWPLDSSLVGLHPEIREHLRGPKQMSDAVLLDLAIRRGGRLATFDKGIRNLLPADSPHQASIEVIPA